MLFTILNFGGKIASNELEPGGKIVPWQPFAHARKRNTEFVGRASFPQNLSRSERALTCTVYILAAT